jgi:transcriptional regulator of acetoin/glycerol metabolism
LDIYNCRFVKKVKLNSDVIEDLMVYDFPGNVRELENIIERCVALSEDNTVTLDYLPSHIAREKKNLTPMVTLTDVAAEAEKAHIIKTIKSTMGNKTRAAAILGISRKTLWEKVKNYHIEH